MLTERPGRPAPRLPGLRRSKTIAIANRANSFGASLATNLAAGPYDLVVHPSGGYGNLGRYTLHGSVAASTSAPSTPLPPVLQPPMDQGEGEGTVNPRPVAS